ncbi:MAG: acylneuraminate cytidylyltransferase, partial [Propionibacterium sp.]|nr:acylneuraminate cytidylyltransferase [Propionibacterium sp.]
MGPADRAATLPGIDRHRDAARLHQRPVGAPTRRQRGGAGADAGGERSRLRRIRRARRRGRRRAGAARWRRASGVARTRPALAQGRTPPAGDQRLCRRGLREARRGPADAVGFGRDPGQQPRRRRGLPHPAGGCRRRGGRGGAHRAAVPGDGRFGAGARRPVHRHLRRPARGARCAPRPGTGGAAADPACGAASRAGGAAQGAGQAGRAQHAPRGPSLPGAGCPDRRPEAAQPARGARQHGRRPGPHRPAGHGVVDGRGGGHAPRHPDRDPHRLRHQGAAGQPLLHRLGLPDRFRRPGRRRTTGRGHRLGPRPRDRPGGRGRAGPAAAGGTAEPGRPGTAAAVLHDAQRLGDAAGPARPLRADGPRACPGGRRRPAGRPAARGAFRGRPGGPDGLSPGRPHGRAGPASIGAAVSTLVVIPARGGSKGVPGKNLARVGGVPLVARAVQAAVAAGVGAVVVSTDDDAIAAVAEAAGARVVRRPAELAGDTASSEAALLHALDEHESLAGAVDVLVMVQCTSPFVTASEIAECVAAIGAGADSAFTAAPTHGFLWRRDGSGQAVGVNHDRATRPRRQDRTPEFLETGAVYAMRTDGFRDRRHRFFGRTVLVETDPGRVLEIDEPADLERARALAPLLDAPGAGPSRADIDAVVLDFDGTQTDDSVQVASDGSEQVRVHRGDGLG